MRKASAVVVWGFLVVALASAGMPGAGAQQVPGVMSENVELITILPDPGAISGEFSRTGDFFYVSGLTGVTAYDVSDPKAPEVLGRYTGPMFENESMTYGERVIAGELRRFVILGIDLFSLPVTDPTHAHIGFDHFHILDVTDPMNMHIVGDLDTTTSTHTVQCVSQQNCRYAYTAGHGGEFEILDFTDLEAPKILKKVKSPAAGPNAIFASGAGHYWDFDTAGVGWHTGSGGATAFDVSDPTNPVPIQATNRKGIETPYNDFILHNSRRPNGGRFEANTTPNVNKGNVVMITEEDYFNDGDEVVCDGQAGTFQTWYIPNMNGKKYRANNPDGQPSRGTIEPLDILNAPAEFGDNAPLATPVGAFCSGHWFDYHQDKIVAQGYYQQGLWFEDLGDPRDVKYYGHYTPLATEIWDAYFVPLRNSNGRPTGKVSNVVYAVDTVVGVHVLELAVPSSGGGPAPDIGERDDTDEGDTGTDDAGDDGTNLPATGGGTGLLLLGAAVLPLAVYIGRRRR